MIDSSGSGGGSRPVQPEGAVAKAGRPVPRKDARQAQQEADKRHRAFALLLARSNGLEVSAAATQWALGVLDSFLAEIEGEFNDGEF